MPDIFPPITGDTIKTVIVDSPPTAPYLLTTVIPISSARVPPFGLRKVVGDPTDWFQTESELVARIDGMDYYEIRAYVDSGSATSFKVDALSDPVVILRNPDFENDGSPKPRPPLARINADAWSVINNSEAVKLAFYTSNGVFTISLTGGFEWKTKMWSQPQQPNGYHRMGKIIRTGFKNIPIVSGGAMGYLQIFATVMPDTPEVQFAINWHNGGIEERTRLTNLEGDIRGQDPTNLGSPFIGFGHNHIQDIIFTRVGMVISPSVEPANGFAGAWTWTPRLPDSVHTVANNTFVKMISSTDSNREHVIPITFERSFRFAVHPSSVTPYLKHVIGMPDLTGNGGGWNLTPMGVPDLSSFGISLSAKATDCKAALTALTPWQIEGDAASGSVPVNALWPMSYVGYGGMTSGTGMLPHYGVKWVATAQKAGYEILLTEQLRVRSRTPGALYYNLSGFPVNPIKHANGDVDAPWRRFNRTFEKQGGVVRSLPFAVTEVPRRMVEADYNPGPASGSTVESPTDPTPGVPDWWVLPFAGDTITPLPFLFAFNQQAPHTLVHTSPPNTADLSVPVIVQVQGGTTFTSGKTVTLAIVGTGDNDLAVSETLVFTGNSASVQAKRTAASFKTVTSITVTAITGTLLSTELFSIGRASVGIADYNGGDNITPMDDQHFIRMHHINRTLALWANDGISKLYCLADAMSARMTQWEGTGLAHRLDQVEHISNVTPGGHGNEKTREFAWCCDMISTAMAICYAHFGDTRTDEAFLWPRWVEAATNLFKNSRMTSGLFQAYPTKEGKMPPYGTTSGVEGDSVFWIAAGREAAYFVHGLWMLCNIRGHRDTVLEGMLKDMGVAFRDHLWHTPAGDTKTGTHVYIPVALHRNPDGTVRPSTQGVNPNGTWTVYANQAALPALNPVSGCVLNPATYPPVDDDLYVAQIDGNAIVLDTPLTLLRNDTNSGGAGLLATPVEVKITAATTFTNGKRRTLRIVGTNPLDVAVSEDLLIVGNSGATQLFRSVQHFKTVTSITMVTAASNLGALVSTEKFKVGTPVVGLHFDSSNSTAPTYSESFQLGYALAVFKHLGDAAADSAAADTCIKRFCGTAGTPAADLAAAKALMLTWGEYTGGPAQRMEQWAPLLWALRAS